MGLKKIKAHRFQWRTLNSKTYRRSDYKKTKQHSPCHVTKLEWILVFVFHKTIPCIFCLHLKKTLLKQFYLLILNSNCFTCPHIWMALTRFLSVSGISLNNSSTSPRIPATFCSLKLLFSLAILHSSVALLRCNSICFVWQFK